MVNGVHGSIDHVVGDVVVEHENVIDCVTILHLPVEEIIV